MIDHLHERLMHAKERLRQKQKFDSMLAEAEKVLQEAEQKQATHKRRLEVEKVDVDKLEGMSLAGVFYSVLGTKEERLEKERQEYLAAKLKYGEATEDADEARRDVDGLRGKLAAFRDADAEYERLLEEKAQFVAQRDGRKGEQLLELSERLADLRADEKELQEAMEAGRMARSALDEVQSSLKSAENWGTWDMMGGGVFATMAKHSKIDEARKAAHEAQKHLQRFRVELADADQRLHASLDLDGFTSFADFFFDGLIMDWVVQSRIQEASAACLSATAKASAASSKCQRRLDETRREVEQVEKNRQQLIESA